MNDPLSQIIDFLKNADELSAAEVLLDTFAKYSGSIEQHDQLARLYHDIKQYPKSVMYAEKVLEMAITPAQQYSARANLAKLYNHVNEPWKSETLSLENLRLTPNNYEAKMELSFSYYLQAKPEKSEQLLRELASDPGTPDEVRGRVLFNLGSYDLDHGDFKKGIRGFIEVGHQIGIWKQLNLPLKKCTSLDGIQKLAVIAEGGIGDEVINVRFMKVLAHRGVEAVWVSGREDLCRVFERNGVKTCRSIRELDSSWYYVQAMSLPILLDLDRDQLDVGVYLKPAEEYVRKWQEKIGPKNKFRVGVKWSGNPMYEQDLHRTLPIADVISELRKYNVELYSLQVEGCDGVDVDYDLTSDIESYEDTLALMSRMDVIVTSCTSVAHVAGAAGLNVIVMPPLATYYTWLGPKSLEMKSDWYSSVTAIRQREWKDWSRVIGELGSVMIK